LRIKYLHRFLQEFLELDKSVQRQIKRKLDEMHRTELDAFPHQALKGDQFRGLYKLRVGDWRLIYRMIDGEIVFVTLGHRSEVYE
jgi:addiction module RelE/StbE family toxin